MRRQRRSAKRRADSLQGYNRSSNIVLYIYKAFMIVQFLIYTIKKNRIEYKKYIFSVIGKFDMITLKIFYVFVGKVHNGTF